MLSNLFAAVKNKYVIAKLRIAYDFNYKILVSLSEDINTLCNNEEESFFNRQRILQLIELYKKYKNRVGTMEIKSMKKMWEIIARDISNSNKITISATKIENKWRVLERNYKKVVDNNNQTGRGRKFFEFEKEFDDIFKKKSNINPEFLLGSTNTPLQKKNSETPLPGTSSSTYDCVIQPGLSREIPIQIEIPEPCDINPQNIIIGKEKQRNPIMRNRKITSAYRKRNDILEEMKTDLKKYYEEKLVIEKEKLELAKRKQQDREKRTKVIEEYLKGKE